MLPFPEALSGFNTPDDNNMKSAGFHYSIIKESDIYTSFYFGGSFAGCCGARQIYQVQFHVGSSHEEKEQFLAAFFNKVRQNVNHYFIATQSQLTDYSKDDGSVLNLLLELGAKQVDDTRNYNPGHNQPLCLHVWSPQQNLDKINEYVVHDFHNNSFVPKWWSKLSEKEQQDVIEKNKDKIDKYVANWLKQENARAVAKKSNEIYQLRLLLNRYHSEAEKLGYVFKKEAVAQPAKW